MSGKTILELVEENPELKAVMEQLGWKAPEAPKPPTNAQQSALLASSDNADAFIVGPETNEVMWLHEYCGDEDPKEIFYCGKVYRMED